MKLVPALVGEAIGVFGLSFVGILAIHQFNAVPSNGGLVGVALAHGVMLAIMVTDTGPGIPAEILTKIFDPYFTTKSATQGTGLGLMVVQRLVQEAKAALHVQTKIGQGTTFTIYLPTA